MLRCRNKREKVEKCGRVPTSPTKPSLPFESICSKHSSFSLIRSIISWGTLSSGLYIFGFIVVFSFLIYINFGKR